MAIEQSLTPQGVTFRFQSNHTSIDIAGQNFTVSGLGAVYLAMATEYVFLGSCLQLVDQVANWAISISGGDTFFCMGDAGTAFINAITNSTNPFSVVSEIMENLAISLTNT